MAAVARFGGHLLPSELSAIRGQIIDMGRYDYAVDDSLSTLANNYIKNGRVIAAEALYKSVIEALDFRPAEYLGDLPHSMWSPPNRLSNRLLVLLDVAYPELIKLLVAKGRHEEALEYAERGRSKHLQAAMQRRRSGGKPPTAFASMNVTQMRALAKETASTFIFYAQISYKRLYRDTGALRTPALYAWVIPPSGEIRFESLPVDLWSGSGQEIDNDPVTQAVDLFTRTIPRGVMDRIVKPLRATGPQLTVGDRQLVLERLHRTLINKLEPHLPHNPEDNIVIVPDNSLYLVPFYALMDASGKYLVERHTISFVPSLSIFSLLKGALPSFGKEPRSSLVVGNPKMPAMPDWLAREYTLPQLPGAEQEARAIAALLQTQPLIGEDASEEEIIRRIEGARIIHFATHGLIVNAAALTIDMVSGSMSADFPPGAIALAKKSSGGTQYRMDGLPFNGFLASGKILTLALDADLVTLSACDTARGRLEFSQFVGLPSALLAAGARSVVMTLWSIPDAPTAELMVVFYKELLTGQPKAVALRRAILATKQRFVDLQNWAAFTLIGVPN